MKHTLLVCTLFFAVASNAQQKEPVYSFVEERHEKDWYETQYRLWKEDAFSKEGSPNAWYNYYVAARSLRFLAEDEERPVYVNDCQMIADTLIQLFPESFEANYIAFWQSGWASDARHYLWKANELSPDDQRLYDDLLIEYEYQQNAGKRAQIAKRMLETNYLSSGILTIGHNVLSELDQNAILFTAGDNDTYAVWLNQFGMGYRADVQTVNIYMLAEPDYRKKMFAAMGVTLEKGEKMQMVETIEYVMKHSKRPVYMLASVYDHVADELSTENLYLTGLNYKYSTETIDNLSLIRRNYEKRYALDHLTLKFTTHRMDETEKLFNHFYILPLVKLYHMYAGSEEFEKQKIVREQLEAISIGGDMEDKVREMLNCTDC